MSLQDSSDPVAIVSKTEATPLLDPEITHINVRKEELECPLESPRSLKKRKALQKFKKYLRRLGLSRSKTASWTKDYDMRKAQKWECNVKDYLKSVLYGGLDGLTTVFVAVATIYSGNISMLKILIIGLAKLFSGALSMGVSDYMATKTENDLIKTERMRELWECDNFIQGEMGEMQEIYEEKGMDCESAKELVHVLSRNKEAFVDIMMVQELGLAATYDRFGPLKAGLANGFSFIFFGSLPLIIYLAFIIVILVDKGYDPNHNMVFGIDCGITALALIFMGLMKSFFSTQFFLIGILTTLIVGSVAGGVGYFVAFALDHWILKGAGSV